MPPENGTANPNCKYPDLKEDLLETIDNPDKAYLLGWIASDGTIRKGTVDITVQRSDRKLLEKLASLFSRSLPVTERKEGTQVGFTVNRQKTVQDACRHLKIEPGPKSYTVQFPELPDHLVWHFLRGLFDGDGSVRNPHTTPTLDCSIATSSVGMQDALMQVTAEFSPRREKDKIMWQGVNALDFMGRLYDGADLFLLRKRGLF